ncbi:mycothiol transferase [Actinomadura gamaensis]|uniref:DinB family protein n=1 Tax=Actinomadura gamaensis TaxID=1763541 RepID=A0ABV9TV57_9ACTN
MNVNEVFGELFGRIPPLVREAVAGLDPALLATPPEPGANTIGWLVWHLTRVQDAHVAEILDGPQLWLSDGFADRFDLPADPGYTGYGHTPEQVTEVRPTADLLVEYHEAVHARTGKLLAGLTPEALDRIVDDRWDPPVTLGVRLVSVADDSLQHVGQAAYVRGVLRRR